MMNKENQKSGNSGSRTQGGSHEQHVEAGRKGGETSRSGSRSSQSSRTGSGSRTQGSSQEQHAKTRHKSDTTSRSGSRKKENEK